MLFTDCLTMKSTDDNNRQSINLSKMAQDILNKDKDMLEVNPTDGYSSLINRIFQSFYSEAEASVPISCDHERDRLREIINEDDIENNTVEKLVQNYKKEVEEKVEERINRKGTGARARVLVRFDKDTLKILASEDCGQKIAAFYEDKYQSKVGKYMKALIEEYCELPYPDRELIYFQSTILPSVREAKEERKMLKIMMHRNNNVLYLKPYTPKSILTDSEKQYNYLVGICRTDNPEYAPQIGAIRLTSIKECRVQGRTGSGTLRKRELTDIGNAISEYGVQYLSDNNIIDLTVKFTKKGERLYLRSIFHLRPAYTSVLDKNNLIYQFRCPRSQALFYFFRYGEDVKIIEPEDLAEEFRLKHEMAAKQYENTPQ